MVQILKNRDRSFADAILGGVAESAYQTGQMIPKYQEMKKHNEQELAEVKYGKQFGKDLAGLSPEVRKQALADLLKGDIQQKKFADEITKNKKTIEAIEKAKGLAPGTLSGFEGDPSLAEKVTREPKKTQAAQPIDPQQLAIIQNIRNSPEYEAAPGLKKYQMMTDAGVSKENAQAEADLAIKQAEYETKKSESAYKAQEDYIDDTTKAYRSFETETKPKLLQMQSLGSDEELIGAAPAKILDELGLPLGVLENPSNELYSKLSQDLLKGLPETYGNKILRVEVENFLKTIPTLMNSPSGRRMIASNMLKLGEMRKTMYDEMRRQQIGFLDADKPLPRDFQQRIFDQVKPQVDRINNEFVKMASIKDVPKNTVPYFSPTGTIVFVPKNQIQEAEKKGGRRIW